MYYIITHKLAARLHLTELRWGNADKGYLVNYTDLAQLTPEEYANEATKVSDKEAGDFIESIKTK